MAAVNNKVQRREVNIGAGMDTSAIATAVQQITGSLVGLTNEIALLSRKTKDMAEPMQQSFKKIADTSGLAGAAVMGMTGIIQDSNYGIRGMANNIQFVVPLLGQLVTQTGSLTGALKSLWSALYGPLGVMLAFSTGITILERFSMRKKKVTEDSKESVNQLAKESAEASVLFAQLTDLVKSGGDMNKIKHQAEEINKKYNLTLDAENVSIESLKQGYLDVVANIRTKLALQKNEEAIMKAMDGQERAMTKLTPLYDKLAKTQEKLKRFGDVTTFDSQDAQAYNDVKTEEARLIKEINAYEANKTGHLKAQEQLLQNAVNLGKKIKEDLSTTTTAADSTTLIKQAEKEQVKIEGFEFNPEEAGYEFDLAFDKLMKNQADTLRSQPYIMEGVVVELGEIEVTGESFELVKPIITKIQEAFNTLKDNMNMMTEQFVEQSITGLFDALGQEMGGNSKAIDEFGQEIIGSFAKFLQQMGAMIFSYGFAMKAFKGAFKNPFAAMAAGVALIAIGGAIKAAHNKKMGGANPSGGAGGDTGFSGGYTDNEVQVYSRLDGRDLVLSNQRSQYQVRR